jgi:hypothetical protein
MAKSSWSKRLRARVMGWDGKRMPLTEAPLRHAGDGVGNKTDELALEVVLRIAATAIIWLLVPLLPLGKVLTQGWGDYLPGLVGGAFAATVITIWALWRMPAKLRELGQWRMGYLAEKAVGQKLEECRYSGARVFHDIERENDGRTWNVDHLVIAQTGIYVVETKARAKPEKGAPEVRLDEKVVRFSDGGYTPEPVTQVLNTADDMREWLAELARGHELLRPKFATRDSLPVKPVIVYAGWYANGQKVALGKPVVVNEKYLLGMVAKATDRHLSQQEVEAFGAVVEAAIRKSRQHLIEWDEG